MSRTVKVTTREMGVLRLHLIEEEGDTWEEAWAPLKGTVFGDQFSRISKEDLNHGLRGWTRPLVNSLSIMPEGALKKIPRVSRECFKRKSCPFYDAKQCHPEGANMPWCYEPDGVEEERIRQAATRAIEHWRERTYLVVVYD